MGPLGTARRSRRAWPYALIGLTIVGILVFYEAQAEPERGTGEGLFPGAGDAIAGRTVLAAAGISPGVMKPFVVLVEHGGPTGPVVTTLRRTPGVAGAVAPTG